MEKILNSNVIKKERIQTLWSGYGWIERWFLDGDITSVIVKKIQLHLPEEQHPRGWNTSTSHQRKIKSYQIERSWYQHYVNPINQQIRMPHCYHSEMDSDSILIILEDLNAAGFDVRHQSLKMKPLQGCIDWLAKLHAHFMNHSCENLWKSGSYWHLATRPDEWNRMEEGWLKSTAKRIDERLNDAEYQTIIHGDAKVANFCFTNGDSAVAAVDFQYVGKGCGMKDIAYLMSSCLSAEECFLFENDILEFYFEALNSYSKSINISALEKEWRQLYPFAWADFARFLMGWAPEHYKLNAYSMSKVQEVKSQLNSI